MIRHNGIAIDRPNRSVSHRGATQTFGQLQFRLACQLILDRPRTLTELYERIYGYRRDGGPIRGRHGIITHFHKFRPKLCKLALSVTNDRAPYFHRRYWIENEGNRRVLVETRLGIRETELEARQAYQRRNTKGQRTR